VFDLSLFQILTKGSQVLVVEKNRGLVRVQLTGEEEGKGSVGVLEGCIGVP